MKQFDQLTLNLTDRGHHTSRVVFLFFLLLLTLLAGCGKRVLATDDFGAADETRWILEGDVYGRSYVENGQLLIAVNQVETMQYAAFRQPYPNFNVQVDAKLLNGNLDSSYGILFRRQEGGTFYRFAITGSGLFGIERRDSAGNWLIFNETGRWQRHPAINTGLGETNRLRISAVGSIVVFSVNDSVIFRKENFDTTFQTGTIALSAGSFSQPGVLAAFDNFSVTEP